MHGWPCAPVEAVGVVGDGGHAATVAYTDTLVRMSSGMSKLA